MTYYDLLRYEHPAPYVPSVSDQQLEVFLGTVSPDDMSVLEQRLYHYHQTNEQEGVAA